jgi:four helix bundle protein
MMPAVPTTIASSMIESYKDLVVWKKAIELVFETYRLTRTFPRDERYGLTAQLRRAAVSIASNIAEGHGRHHLGDYCRFLSIARGSVKELETHFVIAEGLDYVTAAELARARSLSDEVSRMLSAMQRTLRTPARQLEA